MTKFLQELLTSTQPLFPSAISQLERSTGHDGVDVRLIADITHKAHDIMRGISLDTADSTARELYLALNSYALRAPTHELLYDADFVLIKIEDEVVSFNLIDVIENAHHQLPFDQRLISHGQRSLRGEIVQRYHDHPRTDENTTTQLAVDAGLIEHTDQHYPRANQYNLAPASGPYVLAAGDIFTDAFIKLNEDVARVDEDDDGSKRISLPLGTKPPYDEVEIVRAVGPAPNAAVAFARLGLQAGLDSFIGDDETGKEAIQYLGEQSVATDTMLIEKGIKTSYYFVLRYGAERTILVKNEQFNYQWEPPTKTPDWMYLALMSDASWQYHEDLAGYLDENPDIKLAFQPGTFHFTWGKEKLARIYKRSHIVVMNREEAVDVTGQSYDSLPDLAKGLHDLGPEIVVITDGPKGSYASYDNKLVTIPNYPDPAPPVDRTGAGDAFASTIVAALAQGESIETALTWAPINSMSVVQKLGAQAGLLNKDQILKFLSEAPEDYKVTEISS